jgi:hypothetical protein
MTCNTPQGTGFFNVLKSALSAAFGVQSNANRERDFKHGKPIHFIAAGLIVTLVFIAAVVLMVKVMIASSH